MEGKTPYNRDQHEGEKDLRYQELQKSDSLESG